MGTFDTPVPVIDLEVVEANLRRWQHYCDAHGLLNRPHIKTHKLPQLAHKQMEFGAVGITCQKLGEAEVMVDAGLRQIFLPYNILGQTKLERLLALHERCELIVACDSEAVARGYSDTVRGSGKALLVMVECDTGMKRCGVQTPGQAAALAKRISNLPGLVFRGFTTYPTSAQTPVFFERAKDLCADEGLETPVLSGGGTPNCWRAHEAPGINEHRAGTYIYNDRLIVENGAAALKDCALQVVVTVISKPARGRFVIDGGTKCFSSDQYGLEGFGFLPAYPKAKFVRCSEEHGVVEHEPSDPSPSLGERLAVIPNHACVVSNLHDHVYVKRGPTIEARWPVTARGKLL